MLSSNRRVAGDLRADTPAQRALLELLTEGLGDRLVVQAAVAHALSLAGRDDLPASGSDVIAFVRVHMMGVLTSELGPRLTIALLDDLAARLDPGPTEAVSEPPPTPTPHSGARVIGRLDLRTPRQELAGHCASILVVDAHRVTRTSLSRALLRASWDVTIVDSRAELLLALDAGESYAAVLVDLDHEAAAEIVETLVARAPGVAVIARARDPRRGRAALEALGVAKPDLRSASAPTEELVDAVRHVLLPG